MNVDNLLKSLDQSVYDRYYNDLQNINDFYNDILFDCLSAISEKTNNKKTDLFFSVPSVALVDDYDSFLCICFINKYLLAHDFDTLILDKSIIFISWLRRDKAIKDKLEQSIKDKFLSKNINF